MTLESQPAKTTSDDKAKRHTFLAITALCALFSLCPTLFFAGVFASDSGTPQAKLYSDTFLSLSLIIGLASILTLIILAIKNCVSNHAKT